MRNNSSNLENPVSGASKLLIILGISFYVLIVTGCSQLPLVSSEKIADLGKPPANAVFWSPTDQNRILVSAGYLGFGEGEIYVFDIETGAKQVLASTERGMLFAEAWSPDGKSVVVSAFKDTKGFEQGGVWRIDLESGEITYILSETINNIVWEPELEQFIFTRVQKTEDGKSTTELVSKDIKTKDETVILSVETDKTIVGYSLSPDGKRLVFSMGSSGSPMNGFDLYVLDMSSKNMDRITNGGDNRYPIWSTVDDLIVYENKVTVGGRDIFSFYLINPNNSCTVKLFESDFLLPPTWSPDGNFLAFIEPNKNGIFVANINDLLIGDYKELCQ